MSVTKIGLNRTKKSIMKMAQANDPELNFVLQEAVRGINRLIMSREIAAANTPSMQNRN